MKKIKENKIVFILIFLILFIVIIDIGLTIYFRKNTGEKKIVCQKQSNRYINEELNIEYTLKEDYYSFFVTKEQVLYPDIYRITILFDNIEDFNTYYNYLVNDIHLQESNLSKDEKNFQITYSSATLQGGYAKYETEYMEMLTDYEYSCQEEK